MINAEQWVREVLSKAQQAFGERLLYLGLQGSYRRGEATETSDIDLVVLLDTLDLNDLDIYREIVHAQPEGEKACGFICGIKEFSNWPRYELFPLKMDTADFYNRFDDFLPPITRQDIQTGAKIAAAGLFHLLTHSYLYANAESRPEILKGAFKSAFFVLQSAHYLETGVYLTSKKDLLSHVSGNEKKILEAGLNFPAWLKSHSEKEAFDLLRNWCAGVIRNW